MSGRFPAAKRKNVSFAGAWAGVLGNDAERARLLAALALSCLLHAAFVLLSSLGERPALVRYSVIQGKQQAVRALTATLGPLPGSQVPIPSPPTAGARLPASNIPGVKFGPRRADRPATADTGQLPELLAYYATGLLTKRPQPLGSSEELDPPELRALVGSGKMVLRLWIDDRGNVARAEIESSTLPPLVTRKAAAHFERLRFTPAERSGHIVGTIMRIEVAFDDPRKPPE